MPASQKQPQTGVGDREQASGGYPAVTGKRQESSLASRFAPLKLARAEEMITSYP